MLYNQNVYLITNKFYTIPAYEDYNQTKNADLLKLDPQYQEKNTLEKWQLLMDQFQSSLHEEDIQNISLRDFKQELTAFKNKRKNTSASLFNLSLTQCSHYFEEFYFLYAHHKTLGY